MWQVVASSDPRMETEPILKERNIVRTPLSQSLFQQKKNCLCSYIPSLGVVTANSLCWTYRRPLGSTT